MRRGAIAVALLAACGAPPLAAPPSRAVVAPSASALAPPELFAQRIEAAPAIGCALSTVTEPTPLEAVRLFASPEDVATERTLVRARFENATFSLLIGESDGGAFAELDGWGMRVAGFVRRSEVPVWVGPQRRLAGGMWIPGPDTRVSIVRVLDDAVIVRVETHPLLDPAALPFEESVPCAGLTATRPLAQLPSGAPVRLRTKGGLDVRPTPSKDAAAPFRLFAPEAVTELRLEAIELERSQGFVHVVVPAPAGAITGWVAAAAVVAQPGVRSSDLDDATLALVGPRTRPRGEPGEAGPRRCKVPLRIAAFAKGGAPTWVGELRPGAAFGDGGLDGAPSPPPGWAPIRSKGLLGHLVVRETDLAACVLAP